MESKFYRAAVFGDFVFLKTAATGGTGGKVILSKLTPKKNSILHIAAEAGMLEFLIVAVVLIPSARRALLYRKNSDGDTALHLAVRMGHPRVVDYIVDVAETREKIQSHKKLLQIVNMDGDSFLHLVARHGNRRVAKRLITADSTLLSFLNKANESPLFVAVDNMNYDVASLIFTSSLAVAACSQLLGAANIRKKTVLHALCSALSTASRVSRGCVPKAYSGFSINMYVVHWFDIMKKVVEELPDLAKQGDSRGWTPLHYAADSDITSMVQLLLEKDPSTAYLVNNDGESPLHIAASRGHVFSMDNLIKACPDCWDLQDNRGRTVLHAAVVAGQQASVNYMLKLRNDVFVNEVDEDGNTALHLAALHYKDDDNIFKILEGDTRTRKLALNKDSFTAIDIIASQKHDDDKVDEKTVEHTKSTEEVEKIADDSHNEKGYFGSFIDIGGVLVATIAFTAPFSMPGGFVQSGGGKEAGMAVASSKSFSAFVIFVILAFFLSSYRIFLRLLKIEISFFSYYNILNSYTAIMFAFTCGVYAILDDGLRSASLIVALLCIFVVPMIVPVGSFFAFFNKTRRQSPNANFVEMFVDLIKRKFSEYELNKVV